MWTAFGNLLSEARNRMGVTLRALATLVGRSPSYLSELEHGDKVVPIDHHFFGAIAQALNLKLSDVAQAAEEDQLRRRMPTQIAEKLGGEVSLALCRAVNEAEEKQELSELNDRLLKLLQEWENKTK